MCDRISWCASSALRCAVASFGLSRSSGSAAALFMTETGFEKLSKGLNKNFLNAGESPDHKRIPRNGFSLTASQIS